MTHSLFSIRTPRSTAIRLALWLTVTVLSTSTIASASQVNDECANQTTDSVEWSYCISRTEGSKNPDVAYFFHGIYGSENDWSRGNAKTQETWDQMHTDAPTVVSISFGNVWLLSTTAGSELTGKLMGIFINTAIPQIEKQLGGLRGKRMLIGKSMGGFNAAEAYLWYPQLFSRVALLCPALSPISPYASDEEIEKFIERTGASSFLVQRAQGIAKSFFTTEARWNAISPMVVAPQLIKAGSPKLYVSIGKEDQWGFFEGAETFAKVAQSKAVSEVQWLPTDGGHCSYDPVALAHFLAKSE